VGPTINKRSTKTAVVVKDNQTVVIGGLIQDSNEDQITKVPLLGDIPLLGQLFQSKTTSRQKTNLIVFLNPHVIKEAGRLAEITKDKQREFAMAENRYLESELLVKFRDEVNEGTAREIIAGKGASVIRYLEGIKVYHIRLPKGLPVEDAVKDFSALPEVEYAEPNYGLKLKGLE
jgi:general secretion pathway protein D